MRKPHLAFLMFPHAPHVNPTLSVVKTLVRRGYRVSYLTSERFAPRITQLGAEVVLCPSFQNPFTATNGNGNIDRHPLIALSEYVLSKLTASYQESHPTLIVYDFLCLAGPILARRWGIPAIRTSPAIELSQDNLRQQLKSSEFASINLELNDVLTYFWRENGVDEEFLFFRERLNIYFYPKRFQLEGNDELGRAFYAGRCAAEQPYRPGWRPHNADDRRVVLVSTSTLYCQGPEYYQMCMNALSRLECHVILAIGDNNVPKQFEPLPSYCEILQGLPQIQALPYSDLFIFLGGMISTVEASYHGVPLLMMTHGHLEAELYAENAVRIGLGRHVKGNDTNADTILAVARQIWEDVSLLAHVKEVQRLVQREPGAEETANEIVRFLESVSTTGK